MKLASKILRLLLASLALMTFMTTIGQFQLLSKRTKNTLPPEYVFTWPHPSIPSSYDPIIMGKSNQTSTEAKSHSNFTVKFPLCLVHVGKAGGSSISCGLGLMYADCEGMPRDALPDTYYFHIRRNTCAQAERINTYLVTLRNPIMRLQSWFNFEKNIIPYRKNKQQEAKAIKQRGRLFSECYNDFESFASVGLEPLQEPIEAARVIDMSCPQRAWAAAVGARAFSYHEYYNYEHYSHWLQAQHGAASAVQALRSEHLKDDWATVSKEALFRHVNKGNKTHAKPIAPLTAKAMANLCHALCLEIQYYKKLLSMADNLSPGDVKISLQELMTMCPDEPDDVRDCKGLPEFPQLKIPQGKYDQETKKRFYQVNSKL